MLCRAPCQESPDPGQVAVVQMLPVMVFTYVYITKYYENACARKSGLPLSTEAERSIRVKGRGSVFPMLVLRKPWTSIVHREILDMTV